MSHASQNVFPMLILEWLAWRHISKIIVRELRQ